MGWTIFSLVFANIVSLLGWGDWFPWAIPVLVSGMVKTFESLSDRSGGKSMEGLAHGISEVLVATESGLAVAIPALLLVFLCHRNMSQILQQLNRSTPAGGEGLRP